MGGILAVIQGGKFGHGFISAGLSKAININKMMQGPGNGLNAARTVVAAIVGGSISKLSGGKFGNGAATAALAQAYNGNSFWDKAKVLGKFAAKFMPGVELVGCIRNEGSCNYLEWSLAVGEVAGTVMGGGAFVIPYKMYKAGASLNKLKKLFKAKTNCFVAGTLVHTSKGLKPIEQIKVGDWVASKDDKTGKTAYKPVTQLFNHQDKVIINLVFVDENGEETQIQATPAHPFMLANGQWANAGDLLPNDQIQTRNTQLLRLKSVATDANLHDTFNFEVAEYHTYFVGENGLWVHNDCVERVEK